MISLVIAGVAIYFFQQSRIKRDEAIELSKKATEQEKIAKIALFKNKMQTARTLLEDVKNSYLFSKDYALALRNLYAADSLLKDNIELPDTEKNEREKLTKDIQETKTLCLNQTK